MTINLIIQFLWFLMILNNGTHHFIGYECLLDFLTNQLRFVISFSLRLQEW